MQQIDSWLIGLLFGFAARVSLCLLSLRLSLCLLLSPHICLSLPSGCLSLSHLLLFNSISYIYLLCIIHICMCLYLTDADIKEIDVFGLVGFAAGQKASKRVRP